MKCSNCGNKVKENANFCTECGFEITKEEKKANIPIGVILIFGAIFLFFLNKIKNFSYPPKCVCKDECLNCLGDPFVRGIYGLIKTSYISILTILSIVIILLIATKIFGNNDSNKN